MANPELKFDINDVSDYIDNQPNTTLTSVNRFGTRAGLVGFVGGLGLMITENSPVLRDAAEKVLSPDVLSKGPEVLIGSVALISATMVAAVVNGRPRPTS